MASSEWDDKRVRNLLDAGPGKTLTWEGEVPLGEQAAPDAGSIHASLSGPAPKFSKAEPLRGLGNSAPSTGPAAPPRAKASAPTPQDLLAMANELTARTDAQSTLLDQGPSVGARDDAGGKLPEWLVKEMGVDGNQGRR